MNNGRSDDEEVSFGNVANFASEPPPEETADVHSARTAVAALPDSFLDDLRRGAKIDPTTSRYQVLPDTLLDEAAPTLPPPPAVPSSEARVRELNAAISAALTVAIDRLEPPAPAFARSTLDDLPVPVEEVMERAEVVATETPLPSISSYPATPQNEERWVLVVLALAVLFALLAAGSGVSAF